MKPIAMVYREEAACAHGASTITSTVMSSSLPGNIYQAGWSFGVTVTELEAVLRHYRLRFDPFRDPTAEYARFPSMRGRFGQLLGQQRGYPPTQDEFIEVFADVHAAARPELFTTQNWPGTRARLRRAYPSLVREYHLELLLSEAGLLCTRSDYADHRWGVDLIVVRGPYAVRLHTYYGSARAQAWRRSKGSRRSLDGLELDLPLHPAQARCVGPFHLYGPSHVHKVATALSLLTTSDHSFRRRRLDGGGAGTRAGPSRDLFSSGLALAEYGHHRSLARCDHDDRHRAASTAVETGHVLSPRKKPW